MSASSYYADHVGALRRFARKSIWQSLCVRRARATSPGWPDAAVGERLGIWEAPATAPAAPPVPPASVTYQLDLDIGEVADGYHLIASSVSLWPDDLLFEYAFSPGLTDEARGRVWLNMFYDADVSPSNWDYVGAEGDVQYKRPPPEARYAWFDFFPPDYA